MAPSKPMDLLQPVTHPPSHTWKPIKCKITREQEQTHNIQDVHRIMFKGSFFFHCIIPLIKTIGNVN